MYNVLETSRSDAIQFRERNRLEITVTTDCGDDSIIVFHDYNFITVTTEYHRNVCHRASERLDFTRIRFRYEFFDHTEYFE